LHIFILAVSYLIIFFILPENRQNGDF